MRYLGRPGADLTGRSFESSEAMTVSRNDKGTIKGGESTGKEGQASDDDSFATYREYIFNPTSSEGRKAVRHVTENCPGG